MANKDNIYIFEHLLHIHFKNTGEFQHINTVSLDKSLTLFKENNTIYVRYHGEEQTILIEKFSSSLLVDNAFSYLQSKHLKYFHFKRVKRLLKNIILWIILPLILLIFALAFNAAVTVRSNTIKITETCSTNNKTSSSNTLQPLEIAKALRDGVKTENFSIPFSNGKMGTFYVFTDPLCPHCKDIEPILDSLASDYTIYLFPVSVIGGEQSLHIISQLLCEKQDTRLALWKKIVYGHSIENKSCLAGDQAAQSNNKIFKALNLEGTPTFINAKGFQMPLEIPNNETGIRKWLNQ